MENYLDQAPCLYFSCTDSSIITDVNETLCTSLGYTKSELLGQKTAMIFTVATSIFQQTHFFPLIKMHGYAKEIFITLLTRDRQQVPILINGERKIIDGEPVILHVGIIVANRKKFENELIAAKKAAETALNENTSLIQAKQELQQNIEQLDQQVRLVKLQNEELRQFNRVVTHDLQEPLRKISVFSGQILDNVAQQDQNAIVKKLLRVTGQMRTIISGLQQYVWLTSIPNKFARVDLNMALGKAQQQVEEEFTEIKLIIEKEALPAIEADQEQMELLFYHLLSNAIRFRKAGKDVLIKVFAHNLMLNKFRHFQGRYKYTEFVKLQITDNGIGFDNNYGDQVFELFKRLHPESGSGVGLSLCKKIVDNHHGNISIESAKGGGTSVIISLPLDVTNDN